MIFLLLQKRIFGSYYWEHIVIELQSQADLASKGAERFNQISRERSEQDQIKEEETVSKITRSLDRIKQQQSKLNPDGNHVARGLNETADHFEGSICFSNIENDQIFY